MGIMDRMMERMICSMSTQEKETFMLKMMPIMMKDVDLLKMMPGMMNSTGRLITVTGIVTFIRHLIDDEELRETISIYAEKLPDLSRNLRSKWLQSARS